MYVLSTSIRWHVFHSARFRSSRATLQDCRLRQRLLRKQRRLSMRNLWKIPRCIESWIFGGFKRLKLIGFVAKKYFVWWRVVACFGKIQCLSWWLGKIFCQLWRFSMSKVTAAGWTWDTPWSQSLWWISWVLCVGGQSHQKQDCGTQDWQEANQDSGVEDVEDTDWAKLKGQALELVTAIWTLLIGHRQ